jgi:hypothetical protein
VLVGGRFEIECLVYSGRLGGLFRAHDGETGQKVALKVLQLGMRPQVVRRFLREAEALARLRHDGIAAHAGHGRTPQGEVYLATEWVEGEDLAKRLARKPLCLSESLALGRRVAEALALGHGQGVVHGELRPSKLLLREGRVEGVTLLDYGITSANLAERTVTGTTEIIEALRYLAPEQARGERPGPSADIYSLGCVLFECLTGSPPYRADHAAMVLTHILYEELPHLRQLRPDLPGSLEALLARMLVKRPRDRVADGRALVAEFAAIEVTPAEGQVLPGAPVVGGLVSGKQRLVSVALAMPRGGDPEDAVEGADEDGGMAGGGPSAELIAELQRMVRPYGAQVDGLADGSLILLLTQSLGTAVDQAAQAARAVLALRQGLGTEARRWSMALTTGRGALPGTQLMGKAVRRAVELLQAQQVRQAAPQAAHQAGREAEGPEGDTASEPPVWLDELTAGLLDPRFLVRRRKEGLVLERERTNAEEVRLLLGRRTPYVGREQELDLLGMQLRACAEESVARGVLVLAAAGMGKSRLRQEFLRRVEEMEEVGVLVGRGDPMRTGGAYGVLGQALLERCQLGRATGEERRVRFAEAVGRYVDARDRQPVVEFLGEVCGVPFSDEHRPQLRAARQEPQLLNEQVTAAWLKLLQSECAVHPVLLVLEDLHWSDRATVRLVEVALRELADERLMVLGLARPDVKEMFPGLWAELRVMELRLPALGRRASERLVREMLGALATEEVVTRIVEQAGGHALFLEELIRAAVEGTEGQPAETVLAMLQVRFGRLEPGVRRLLEAASLMGETFWRGGVVELLGQEAEARIDSRGEREIERWLRALVGAETIVRRGTSRFPGETEYAFRHALMRDAAYALLTEEERRAGHRLVSRYLERMGERDLMVLAEHERLGGDMERAAGYFGRAAVQAMQACDLEGTLRCVERGVACGAAGEVLGTMRAAEAWAQFWSGDIPAAYAAGMACLALLPAGSDPWFQAIGPLMGMAGYQGQREVLVEHARNVVAAPLRATESVVVESVTSGLFHLTLYGERALVEQMTVRLREVGARLQDQDARARGMLSLGLLCQPMMMDLDLWPARVHAANGLACFATAGDRRFMGTARGHLAFIRALLGEDKAEVLGECHAVLAELTALRQMTLVSAFQGMFAFILAEMGEPAYLAEAEAMGERMLAESPFPSFWSGLAQVALAEVWAGRGELPRAEDAARQALQMFAAGPVGRPLGFAVLSRILLKRGQGLGEVLATVEQGLAALRELGGLSLLDTKLYLVATEVYQAAGHREAARDALVAGSRLIQRRAAQIPEAAARERFLTGVRDNARLLELKASL